MVGVVAVLLQPIAGVEGYRVLRCVRVGVGDVDEGVGEFVDEEESVAADWVDVLQAGGGSL